MAITFWAVSTLTACGGGEISQARRTLYVSAEALHQIDIATARRYQTAAEFELEHATTREQYDRMMRPWNTVETLLRGTHFALVSTETALDLYEQTGRKLPFYQQLGCLAVKFEELLDAYKRATGDVPQALTQTVALLNTFEGECAR